ncbi:hypothetical protein [Corynebacterium pseudodiphtheriticum]|uniref:hypothetical protein n=1 Tax=Corynebacterium pseudodiphtheriticum TaxID=37637 RepID=UPI00254F6832|nr:hypothetical protein [Corynebacterium pseudodiphtheriticum]MDK8686535.1 hypothetical protein [Corynebacterium pseudodiphtheriticum]
MIMKGIDMKPSASIKAVIMSAISAAALITSPQASAESNQPFSEDAIPESWSDPATAKSIGDGETIGQNTNIQPRAFKATGGPGSCRLTIWDVGWDKNTNWLGVQGGRENCANYSGFRLELKKGRGIFPNKVLNSSHAGGNRTIRTYSACEGKARYYGAVHSDTGTDLEGDSLWLC